MQNPKCTSQIMNPDKDASFSSEKSQLKLINGEHEYEVEGVLAQWDWKLLEKSQSQTRVH